MSRFDWRVAAWFAIGIAVAAIALASGYSTARSTEAREKTIQLCIQRGGHPDYDYYNRFRGCK
jgi:hypothetical protein